MNMDKKKTGVPLPGRSARQPSRLALGTWQLGEPENWYYGRERTLPDEAQAAELFKTAAQAGISLIDTAPVYGDGRAESLCAAGIAANPGHRFTVMSKCGLTHAPGSKPRPDLSERAILDSCEQSLRRLKIGQLDCLLLHWPDPVTPLRETVKAVRRLLEDKLIRSIGACNYRPAQLRALLKRLPELSAVQYMYNPAVRGIESELLPLINSHNLLLLTYSPLCQGLFTRSRRPAEGGCAAKGTLPLTNRTIYGRFDSRLIEWEHSSGPLSDPVTAALNWQLQQHNGGIIIGTTDLHHLRHAAAAEQLMLPGQLLQTAVEALPEHPARQRVSFFY